MQCQWEFVRETTGIQGAIDGDGRRHAEEETGVSRQVGEILCYSYHAFSYIP
jgi:hypothetical protein